MSRRDNIVRELIKHYIELDANHPNKNKLKQNLMDEFNSKFPNSSNESLFDGWIQNEMKNELEEKMEAFVSASLLSPNK
jgi:hypothetical protein